MTTDRTKKTKVFSFGKIAFSSDRKINATEVEITLYTYADGRKVFSASGEIWDSRHFDIVSGGQNLDTMAEYIKDPIFTEILDMWRKYHLNDMHAGTPTQEAIIKAWQEKGNRYDYKAACDELTKHGFLYDNGYKYGTAWLYQPIPADDLARIEKLFIL